MDHDKRTNYKTMEPLPPDAWGYCFINIKHYKQFMLTVRSHLITSHGSLLNRIPQWGVGILIALAYVVPFQINLIYNDMIFLGLMLLYPFILLWYITRYSRFIDKINRDHMCFECGYSLLHSPVDENGYGTCSECGKIFHPNYYRNFPKNHRRQPPRGD